MHLISQSLTLPSAIGVASKPLRLCGAHVGINSNLQASCDTNL